MARPENNEENRFELATSVVDTRSLEDLRENVKESCPNPGCHCGRCEKKDNDIEDWQIEDALNGRR